MPRQRTLHPGENQWYKLCTTCNTLKLRSKFSQNKKNWDKLQSKCKDCIKQYKNSRPRTDTQSYEQRWKYSFGIEIAEGQLQEKLSKQNYCCAICKDDLTEVRWVWDHNHHNNKLRDILCNECNMGLGRFNDSVHLLELAISYLKKHDNVG